MTSKTEAPVADQLCMLLRSFRVAGFAGNYPAVAEQAEKAGLSYEAFLYELAKIEAEERKVVLLAFPEVFRGAGCPTPA